MENQINLSIVEKALKKICENNEQFEFTNDEYNKSLQAIKYNGGELSGKGGIAFMYGYSNNPFIGVCITNSFKEISLSYNIENEQDSQWYYNEFQRLFKLANDCISNLNQ